MHELSVIQALLRQVDDIAAAHHSMTVRRVTIEVGVLSGVEPQLLAAAFAVIRAGCAAQAELVLETPVVRVHCRECGADSDATASRLLCGRCAGWRTTLLSGDELLLRRVEFVADRNPSCA